MGFCWTDFLVGIRLFVGTRLFVGARFAFSASAASTGGSSVIRGLAGRVGVIIFGDTIRTVVARPDCSRLKMMAAGHPSTIRDAGADPDDGRLPHEIGPIVAAFLSKPMGVDHAVAAREILSGTVMRFSDTGGAGAGSPALLPAGAATQGAFGRTSR
jgi:hypothetical protein